MGIDGLLGAQAQAKGNDHVALVMRISDGACLVGLQALLETFLGLGFSFQKVRLRQKHGHLRTEV